MLAYNGYRCISDDKAYNNSPVARALLDKAWISKYTCILIASMRYLFGIIV